MSEILSRLNQVIKGKIEDRKVDGIRINGGDGHHYGLRFVRGQVELPDGSGSYVKEGKKYELVDPQLDH